MDKASKNKSFIRQLLELLLLLFISIAELYFLRLAISLAIMGGMVLAYYYFAGRYTPFSYYFIYFVFLFLLLLCISFEIRRVGAKRLWKDLIAYEARYTGKSGKYYKWFVYVLIFMCIMTAFVILLGPFAR